MQSKWTVPIPYVLCGNKNVPFQYVTHSAPIPHLVLNFKKDKLFELYNKYVNSVFIFLERTLHTEIPYVIFYREYFANANLYNNITYL